MKIDRLLAITMLLLNRKRISAKELAERFEVSLRTIYRDVETISQAGLPITSFSGAEGGYEMMDSYRLDRQMLTLDELQAIIIALRGVKATLSDQVIGRLLDKVGALMAKSEHSLTETRSRELLIDINPWSNGNEDKEKLALLRQAIQQSQMIHFAYISSDGADSVRACEPAAVVLKGYIWYLYGYCLLRDDFRIFRLSRIRDLTLDEQHFDKREIDLDGLQFETMTSTSNYPMVTVQLRFQPSAKARVYDYFSPSSITAEKEGTLLVTSTQPDEPWLYRMLLEYGEEVKVLAPAAVAKRLVEKAENIIRMYKPY
ncbi:helix-turn-helix transcriptional regulator [Paenibacillus sp. NPDC058071]|uniref:helix-turn-helix transcriptional regulator n=1 Tax=Paenibacillus sp. NPDC058071 TaxID=3346326 RepID=UPI0036D82D8B